MTPQLARFIANTRAAFARFTFQQLYQLAVSLASELHDRGVDAEPEARALVAALLAYAQREHVVAGAADCALGHPGVVTRDGTCARCLAPIQAPAEKF